MARRPSRNDRLREELAAIDQEVDGVPAATRRLHRVLPVVVATVALASFGAITWYAYNQGILEGSEEAAPFVRPTGPLKTAPASPGGLEVPNRDKFVYNQLEQKNGDSKVERLLPPPEQPKPPPRPAPEPETSAGKQPSTPEGATELPKGSMTATESFKRAAEEAAKGAPPRLPPPGAVEPETADGGGSSEQSPKAAEKGDTGGAVRLAPGSPSKPAPPPPKTKSAPKKSAAVSSGKTGYFVQLSALRSEADAMRAWEAAQEKNRALLGSRSLDIDRASVPNKGVFYRVQTGPFTKKADADKLCNGLKQRKQSCFVVRRK